MWVYRTRVVVGFSFFPSFLFHSRNETIHIWTHTFACTYLNGFYWSEFYLMVRFWPSLYARDDDLNFTGFTIVFFSFDLLLLLKKFHESYLHRFNYLFFKPFLINIFNKLKVKINIYGIKIRIYDVLFLIRFKKISFMQEWWFCFQFGCKNKSKFPFQ